MFLHSGASLHGHEYSNKRHSAPAGNTAQRRNPLLRSSLASPVKRTSSYHPPPEPSSPASASVPVARPTSSDSTNARKPTLPVSPPTTPEPAVRFHAPRRGHNSFIVPEDVMSEDEQVALVSDSEISHAASSVRRPRRRTRHSTVSYLLAQPPPRLSAKQKLLHFRPQLLLQTQHVMKGARPKPTIDMYPASITYLAAPLFKRLPGFARIKAELGVRDILLFKCQDFGASPSSAGDDEQALMKREVVALLCPLEQEKAEIVLADGSVWSARVCNNTKNFAYEFTIRDEAGQTTTARWVRRRQPSKPGQASPSTPSSTPGSSTTAPPDFKFTFSIIDPSTRRHPVMATLTAAQLDVQDSYTDTTPSASLHSPSSSHPSSPPAVSKEKERVQAKSSTRNVEEWQKTFIHVSALWVALHQGWVSHFDPAMFAANSNAASPTTASGPPRTCSFGSEKEPTLRTNTLERLNRYRAQSNLGSREPSTTSLVPRRATSSGAAFGKKRIAQNRLSSVDPGSSDILGEVRPERRAFSSEWEAPKGKAQETSLANVVAPELSAIRKNSPAVSPPAAPALAPSPLPNSRQPSPMPLASPRPALLPSMEEVKGPAEISRVLDDHGVREGGRRRGNSRWNRMSNWVRKLKVH